MPLSRPITIRRPSSFAARSSAAISASVNSRGSGSGAGKRAGSAASKGGEPAYTSSDRHGPPRLPPAGGGSLRLGAGKELDQPYGEEPECDRRAETDARVARIKGAPRQLRHTRRFEDLHLGSDLAVARFQSRQAVRSGAVQLFKMREILLHRLELAKTHHKDLHRTFVFIDLLLQLLDGF